MSPRALKQGALEGALDYINTVCVCTIPTLESESIPELFMNPVQAGIRIGIRLPNVQMELE